MSMATPMLSGSLRTVFVLTSAIAAACSVGEVPIGGGGGGPIECVERITPAGLSHAHLVGGGTNAGTNCVAAGCHRPGATGAAAPAYQFGGTIYATGTTTPSAGATVRIQSGTTVVTAVTDDAGNFSFPAGSLTGTFSAQVDVSACPSGKTMPDALVSGGDPTANNCSGCHGPGGTTTPIAL